MSLNDHLTQVIGLIDEGDPEKAIAYLRTMYNPVNNEWSLLVLHFQKKFGQAYVGVPRELPASVASLRKKLIQEETQELVDAIDRGELHEQLDAIVDLLYVVVGTANAMGFYDRLDEAFRRVHEANMKKVATPTRYHSKRDSQWDIVKPEGWVKPDLTDLVR